jgi:hypothetical protein
MFPSRKTVWVAKESFEGWGCSECAWVFNPSGKPVGQSLDEMKRHFQTQLLGEFASHACVKPLRRREGFTSFGQKDEAR